MHNTLPHGRGSESSFVPTASLENLRRRAALLSFSRRFFERRGYLEFETPLLSPDIVVDTHLEPFATRFLPDPASTSGVELFLQTSPEFSLKRLLACGSGPVFEVFRAFRNSERGRLHNPEFTLIEWYRPGDTHVEQMAFTEEYVRAFFDEAAALRDACDRRSPSPSGEGLGVRGAGGRANDPCTRSVGLDESVQSTSDAAGHPLTPSPSPPGEGGFHAIVFDAPFERLTYDEAFERHAGRRVLGCGVEELARLARKHRVAPPPDLKAHDSQRDAWLNLLLAELVEPHLGIERPTFLYDYPASQAALACVRDDDPPVAERFELYIRGIELCNGYHELLDAVELRRRNREQNAKRAALGLRTLPEDSRLLAAMEHGLPSCAGVALGFDRLVMVALGLDSVAAARAFPTEGLA